jgi:hypothetical protein
MNTIYERLNNLDENNDKYNSTLVSTDEARILLNTLNELALLKQDAYFMRYCIHEKGLHDWLPEQKKRMEAILYDENDKLKQ